MAAGTNGGNDPAKRGISLRVLRQEGVPGSGESRGVSWLSFLWLHGQGFLEEDELTCDG